jgi:DNA-binding transcriptional MocR family regulator
MAALLQIELVPVPIDAGGLDIDAFARLSRRISPRAAVLTPVTQNPTTASLNAEARRAVIAAARDADIILIEDDIFGHLVAPAAPPLAALAPERSILVTSLSKCIAPGMRIGYALAPLPLRDAMATALHGLGWTGSNLYGALARRLVTDGTAEHCLRAQRAEALERTKLARLYLGDTVALGERAGIQQPLYHAWLPLPPGRQADRFTAELLSRQVLVAPAYHFMQAESQVPEAVRISLGCESRALLESALQRIAAALRQQGSSLAAVG